jgi:hypothetical protein
MGRHAKRWLVEFSRYGKCHELPLYHEEAVDRLVKTCAKYGYQCRVTDMGRNLLEGGADAIQAI